MPISPINFFTPTPGTAEAQSITNPTALANLTGATPATLASFGATLGRALTALGPAALATTLGAGGAGGVAGTGGAGVGAAGGVASTIFDLLLLNSLGLGQFNTQNNVQQLLQTELLLNSLNTAPSGDPLGLTTLATDQVVTSLVRQMADGNLFVQLNNVSTQPNPAAFSTAALAQDIQLANAVELPA